MTLNEAVAIVARRVPGNRHKAAQLLSNVCRFDMGMNYKQTFEYIQKKAPEVELNDWESLLYEVDEAESRGLI